MIVLISMAIIWGLAASFCFCARYYTKREERFEWEDAAKSFSVLSIVSALLAIAVREIK